MDNIILISWPRDRWAIDRDEKQAIELSAGNLIFITGRELKRHLERYKLKLLRRDTKCIRYEFIKR